MHEFKGFEFCPDGKEKIYYRMMTAISAEIREIIDEIKIS